MAFSLLAFYFAILLSRTLELSSSGHQKSAFVSRKTSGNLILKCFYEESNVQAVVQQSASEIIQQGDSVTLNCTVHTGTCDEEHSVYWFQNSDESHSQSHPGLIYTHWGGNDQCEKEAKTQTHTCVYNLPMNNLNLSHAGTYYCAVASCGHILFGNGTKLDFEHNVFWSGTFAVTSILSVLLAFSVCVISKKCICKSPESQASLPKADATGFQEAERLYFPSSTVNLRNRSRSRKDRTWSECVYYSVKQ
ncbi:uncharacterized protein LOC102314309 isoform X2 [Haplochromis burtoni]|uniref:uncharacterized protein LOC102314309 isoform X2 n=1 Tax=Haplochromis burtoni TaxID=8153 RepID=UPI0003BD899F|nr:uncharacterized protein LOC102314309 isoform X2 [Haplochromis burtoni]